MSEEEEGARQTQAEELELGRHFMAGRLLSQFK
jgi:hypothetical protein